MRQAGVDGRRRFVVSQLLVALGGAFPGGFRVVEPAQAPRGLASHRQRFGALTGAVSRQQPERALDQAMDLLEGADCQGIPRRLAEVGGGTKRVGRGASRIEVMADL